MAVETDVGEEIFEDDVGRQDLGTDRASFGSKRRPHHHDPLEEPLLSRQVSLGSYSRDHKVGDRRSQRIYMRSEDLTAVFTGYSTSVSGFLSYITLCTLTLGLAYLVFRWLPRWRIKLIGRPTPFWKCHWIAVKVGIGCFSHISHALKVSSSDLYK